MYQRNIKLLAALSMLFAGSAVAAVSATEAKQLGTTLTLWGAEKAANKDGTIPEYTGTPIKVPASYDPKNPKQHPDPFGDKPLFTITAQNSAQYAERLTEGQKTLFATYPGFRMDVYRTHRTAGFPQQVLDNTVKNATSCKGVDNELKLEGCYGGFPFPIPKTGAQAMWNHLLAYEPFAQAGRVSSWLVPAAGAPVLQSIAEGAVELPFYNPAVNTGANKPADIYFKTRQDDLAPARRVGQKVLVIDAVDQLNVGRRAWQYIPGQRRVKLAPDLSYDTPNPFSGGTSTMDDAKGFLGALDRFEWKLAGRQEKYILYNAFALQDAKVCPDSKLTATKNVPNPECLRWELHRVWVVNGTLKPGFRHIYAKRTLYWDEDGYTAGQGESYDAAGKMYRVVIPMHFTQYEGVGSTGAGAFTLDLATGSWGYYGSGTVENGGWTPVKSFGDTFFSPEDMAGGGIR